MLLKHNLSIFPPSPHALACGMFRKIGGIARLAFAMARNTVNLLPLRCRSPIFLRRALGFVVKK